MAKIKTETKNGKVYTYRNGKLFSIQPIKQTAAKSTPSGYGTSSRETASFVNSSVGVGSNRNRIGSVQHTNAQNAQKSQNAVRESKTGKVYKAGVGYQDRAAQSKTYNYGSSNIAKARKAEEAAKNQLKVAEDEQKKLVDRYGSDTAALEASIAGYSNRSDFEQNLDAANKKLSTAQETFNNARNNRSMVERNETLKKQEDYNTFVQNKYTDLMNRDKDAELYIKEGERSRDSAKSFKDINKNDAWKIGESFAAVGVSEKEDKNAAKVFMNDAERNQYNYLLGKFGKIEADNYYNAIYDDKVAPRFASYLSDMVEADEKDSGIVAAGKTVGRSAQAFLTGAQEGFSGIGAAFRRMTGDTSIDSESLASMTHAEIASKLDGAEKIVNDVVYNVGHMMPTIVTSIATGGLGAPAVVSAIASSSSVGLSSFGNTYEEAIREGYSPDQATAYGILTGVSEGALQYALNGISKIAGGALTGKAAKAAQGAIKRVAKNPQAIKALNLILERSVDASGEFTEEYLQEVLDPVFKNIAYNESNEVKLVSEEALYSGLLGALTAGGMNAATDIQQTASRYLENSRSEKAFDNSYVRAGVQAAQNNPYEVRLQATPVLNKYAGRETVDGVLGRTYETNMPVLESLAGKDAVLRAVGEETDIYAGRIALKNSAAVSEAISKLNADPVTYDDSGNVIPLSERFNQQKKDIGYALRGVKAKLPYDRTAILEESTVDKYLSEYAAKSNGKYSNAYIAYMSPDDFLKLTTGGVVGRARVEAESKKLNAEQFRTVTPKDAIRLYIDADTGEVSGHEGMHRMAALLKDGIDNVPVILYDSNNKYGKSELQDLELTGQFNNNAKVSIGQAIPLNYNNRDRIIKMFATRSSMQRIAERTNTRQTLKFSVRSDTETKQSPRQTLDEMARQYGTIKPGETPVRESNLPKKTSKDRFLSQFARTLYESGSTTEEMLPALESKLAAGDFSYEKIKNSKLASIAQKTVAEGMDSAQKIWDGLVENSAMPKADDIALGQTLYNEYVKNGDYDSAIKIASELAVEATRLGQSVQAFRLLKKLTPDGQLYVLERTKNNIKKELIKKMGDKAPDITIDETLAENLLRAKTPQEIESAVDAIKQDIADQMPATFADKVNAWRYLAMLGNPRTHIRNIAGNTIFIPMRAFKNLIGAGLEKAVKVEQSKRTKTVLNTIKDKEYIDAGKKSFETVKDILQNTDKYGERDIYNRRQIFNSRFLETARKLNFKALELEDVIFMKSAYVNSYAQAMKARGLTSDTMTTKQESDISEYAIQEALKATYRDFNGLASALNRIKNANKATNIIGEGVAPFTTTPLNILKRGVEYSPVGVAKGMYEVLHDVKNGVKTPAEAIDTISAGLSGTAIMAIGAVMSALGLISVGGDDDGEDALFKLTGGQNYAIEIAGHSYTIDWASPTVLPLFVGVELEKTFSTGDPLGSVKNLLDSITQISDPLINLSMLSGLNSAIEAAKYSDSRLTDIAISIGVSYAGQYIPTGLGQIARISDDTVRRTYYDKNSPLPKAVDSFVQGVMKKIPGLNFLLQPSVDRWGREIKSGSIGERLSENLVSPGYYSKRNFTNVDVEIDRLYKQIGESAVIPPVPEKYFTVDGERKDLSASEYTQYSKLLGQGCYTAAEQTVNNPEYSKLSDREKSAAIQEAYNYAKQTAKSSISGYTVDNWVSELNKSGVNKGLYFSIKAKTSGIESNKDAQGNTIENSKSLKIKDVIDNTTSNEANKKKLYDLFDVNKKVASGYVTWDDANKPKLSNDNKTQIKQAAGYDIPKYKTETLENIQNIGVSVEDYAYIDDRIAAYGDKVGYIKSFGFNDKQTSGLVQSLVMGKNAKDKMRVANEEYGISNDDYIRTYMAGYSSVGSKSERNAQIRAFVDSLQGLTDEQKDMLYEYNAVSRGKYDSEKEKSGSSGGKRSSGKRSSSRKKTVPNLSVPGVKNVSISKTRSDLVRTAMQNYMKQKQQSDLTAAYKAQLDEIDKNPFMTQKIRAAQKAKIKERFGIN